EQRGLRNHLGGCDDGGQELTLDTEEPEELVVPLERRDVEEQRPGGVGLVRRVDAAARQLPDEPRVDRPEGQLGLPQVGLRKQPSELRGGEIGVADESGALAYEAGG